MPLVLHKIVRAIKSEEHTISGIAKLEQYGLDATSNSLRVRELKNIDGIMHLNGRTTEAIAEDLAMGFTSALRDVYHIDAIPRSLELRTIEDVKLHPSYAVGENLRFASEKLEPELGAKLDAETKRVFGSRDSKEKITPEMVKRNPVLQRIYNKVNGKTLIAVGGTVVSFSLGITAFCLVVNAYREKLTTCMLYYYNDDDDNLRSCTIKSCICKKVDCTENCNYCSVAIMAKYLPADMITDNCSGFKGSEATCINCPSKNFQSVDISDDETLTADDIRKTSYVRCQKPDFFEAMSALFGGISEDLLEIVKGSLNGISWLVTKLPYILLFFIIGIAIVIIISIFKKFSAKSPRQEDYYGSSLSSSSQSSSSPSPTRGDYSTRTYTRLVED